MAEALATIGVIASIAQLVELSTKVISRVHEFTSRASDVPSSFRSLAAQLQLLSITLQNVQAQLQSRQLEIIATQAIKAILDNMLEDIGYLERVFMPVKPDGRASIFDRSLQALKSLAREDRVQQRIDRIQANIQLIGFHQTTTQMSIGREMLEMLKDSEMTSLPLAKDISTNESRQSTTSESANDVVSQFRDLLSSMVNSVYAVKSMQTVTRADRGPTLIQWLLHVTSPWSQPHHIVKFLIKDWNHDGTLDLVAIKKQQTNTQSTELHVFSGSSVFQYPLLELGTALHETSDNFDFLLTDWTGDGSPDLFVIKKNQTGSNSTEVHILCSADNFQSFALQTPTALHETANNAKFLTADWTGTGRPDLVFIKQSQTGSNKTEVHILASSHCFSFFLLHSATVLPETDESWEFIFTYEFSYTHRPDLVAVKKDGAKIEEICILSGADDFRSFVFRSGGEKAVQSQRERVLEQIGLR